MTDGPSAPAPAAGGRLGLITREPPRDLEQSYGGLGLSDVIVVVSGPDEAERVRLLAPQSHQLGVRFTCVVEPEGLDFLLGILDSGVDGVWLRDPPDAAALREFVRACRYPPGGIRGVATGRDLGYGLDDAVLRHALSHGRTTAIGVVLSAPDDSVAKATVTELTDGWARVQLESGGQGGGVPGLDFAALWGTAPDGGAVQASESLMSALRALANEVHLWGEVTGPQAHLADTRAWDEGELLRRGLCDARRR